MRISSWPQPTVRPPRGVAIDGAGLEALSKREREVLLLLGRGLTNQEIGYQLFVRQNTVAKHVSRILAKTRASNRVEAAALAMRAGLLS